MLKVDLLLKMQNSQSLFNISIGKCKQKNRDTLLVEVLDSCPMDIFSNINALLRVMVTLPMTACTVENFFHCASNKDSLKVVDVHTQAQQPVAIIHGT